MTLLPTCPRPKRLTRLGWLVMAAGGLGLLIAVLAVVRVTRTEPAVAPPAPVAVVEDHDAERQAYDPSWTIADDPIQRMGFRRGHRHAIDVVPLGPKSIEVEIRTARAFLTMRAAAAETGVELGLESGFRTAEQQRALFRAWRNGTGNKAARPGQSNHQSGRALDITTSAPGALAWLEANAAAFGFERTVKTEPWHWEYIEIPVARGAISRKSGKHVKLAGHARRPAQHASSVAKTSRSPGRRVAASAR